MRVWFSLLVEWLHPSPTLPLELNLLSQFLPVKDRMFHQNFASLWLSAWKLGALSGTMPTSLSLQLFWLPRVPPLGWYLCLACELVRRADPTPLVQLLHPCWSSCIAWRTLAALSL